MRRFPYLILIALLALGIATVVRDSTTGIVLVLALLHVVPLVSQAIDDPRWQHVLQQVAPGTRQPHRNRVLGHHVPADRRPPPAQA